ncbi:hypothetical protein V565_343900 [Rhizoctonia solani 123E]|uniref:Uncharacterized protein n=1 Tax=Rhizoctonia solani 123E TaxID=1423351 RepID=A0A074RJP4_9AGAM|nr:hypothetical protein V565_343900 [Rhizoctonia solani 123E]
MANMTICKAYFITIAMCPDVKMGWFHMHFSPSSVEMIQQMIIAQFNISYLPPSNMDSKLSSKMNKAKPSNCWLHKMPLPLLSLHMTTLNPDSIEVYLAVEMELLSTYGAPVTSVDVKRAFSAGHLTINHLQHVNITCPQAHLKLKWLWGHGMALHSYQMSLKSPL